MSFLFNLIHGFITKLTRFFFGLSSLFLLLLLFLTVEQVISRYFFNSSQVALQELEWHLFGFLITLSIAYTLEENGHVRVDILSNSFGRYLRRFIHMLGFLVLIPLCLALAYFGILDVIQARSFTSAVPEDFYTHFFFGDSPDSFIKLAFRSTEIILRETILVGEGSSDAGGLEARWIVKAAFPLGMLLLALQSFSLFLRCFQPSTKNSEKYSWL